MSKVLSAKMASVLLLLCGVLGVGQTLAAVCNFCDNQWVCKEVGDLRVCVRILVCHDIPCAHQN